ncbi:MAG: efflux RND transporter permease subunit [Alphaproteobacteria bacterium]|nr:efflux RND transporter permease subunit [Alphaproteobacteria bacterium]MDE2498820.1 efflux RND transporter permease subunit [Alphaproteobacteria bacterium]
MRWLVALCLRRKGAVAALTLLALVLGAFSAFQTPLDVFPEFVPPSVTIQTEAPGLSPMQVEQLVTKPLEDAINGAPGLLTLRSKSIPGLSVITIEFHRGINLYHARQGISELLSEVQTSLPSGVGPPKLSPLFSSTMDLLRIGLVSDKVDAYTLRDRADWLLKPHLLAVPGVAYVTVYGGAVRQIHIQPDLKKLTSYGFTLSELVDAARKSLALRGAGFIDTQSQRILLQLPTPTPDIQAIGDTVLAVRSNTPILLRDVATVKQAPALRPGDTLIEGRPGVLLVLTSQYGANTLAVTHAAEAALAELTPRLEAEGIHVYPALHRPANFIERALGNLEQALLLAGLLILAVLYLFLRDWRSALITFLAIPLSLVAAVAVLNWRGETLNTMTLGGFAVSLGVLVDDAIIGIENILRRLRENALSGRPRTRLDVILESALEVRGPVIYATLVVIAVFLPELFSTSVQGRFVGPLAFSFILAVLASLAVALTATPALCALFLRAKDAHEDASWLTRLKALQATAIGHADRHFKLVVGGLVVLFAGSLLLLPFLGGTLMPDFKEGHFVIQVQTAIPGTSIDEMKRIGVRVSREILELPYVKTVEEEIGRADLSEDTNGPHEGEFHVELKADANIDQSVAENQLRQVLSRYPGIQTEVVTFLGDRISESLSGETAQVAIKIFGDDLDTLDTAASHIVRAISDVPGIVDLQFSRQSGTPQLSIRLLPEQMAAAGLNTQDVLDAIEADYAGTTVGQTYVGTRSIDVVVMLPARLRHSPVELSKLMIGGPLGAVPLSQVAEIAPTDGRYSIRHDGGQRFVSVTFNVSGRSLQDVVSAAKARIARNVVLPAGTYLDFAGAAAAEQKARFEFLLYSAFAFALIVMVLFISFRWPAHAWLVMANLPFSLIGGILAAWLTGLGLTLGVLVGLVTVFGISARNAILLLAHYEHLVEEEGRSWNLQTVLQGAQERLIPILMTASVTALGLLPLALAIDKPGQEIQGPMAVTVLGGLLTSTLLNLVFLPELARRFGRK